MSPLLLTRVFNPQMLKVLLIFLSLLPLVWGEGATLYISWAHATPEHQALQTREYIPELANVLTGVLSESLGVGLQLQNAATAKWRGSIKGSQRRLLLRLNVDTPTVQRRSLSDGNIRDALNNATRSWLQNKGPKKRAYRGEFDKDPIRTAEEIRVLLETEVSIKHTGRLVSETIGEARWDHSLRQRSATNRTAKADLSVPWHLDRIDQATWPAGSGTLYNVSSLYIGGTTPWIYVVDSGVHNQHPEFSPGRVFTLPYGGQYDLLPRTCNSHGTCVASIAAGNTVGVNPDAFVWDVRVLDCAGGGTSSTVLEGIMATVDHCSSTDSSAVYPIIINLSLGGYMNHLSADPSMSALGIELGLAKTRCNAFVAAAAGNDNDGSNTFYPAMFKESSNGNVVGVGASTFSDKKASFSNWGRIVDIWAPGSSILCAQASYPGYGVEDGTSMATPVISGIASLAPRSESSNIRSWVLSKLALQNGLKSSTLPNTTTKLAQVYEVPTSDIVQPPPKTKPPKTKSSPSTASSSDLLLYWVLLIAFISCILV